MGNHPIGEVLEMAEHGENLPPLKLDRTVVLVGLMGAGKSTVGRRLADALGVPFVDSDHEIETAANLSIPEIFERFGEQYFRDGESRVIARLLEGEPCILATGGGAFMSPDIRALIHERGLSVWIKADLETLWNRVKGKPGRPLLQQENAKEVLATLLEARYPVYAEADLTVESHAGALHEDVVADIIAALRAHAGSNEETP